MLSQSKSRLLCGLIRTFSTSPQALASHYDVLGITPKATQGDIKTAYYKLSKVYHPDISKDEESAKMFRVLTEAYEVLGNVKLKKMYDKGLLVGRDSVSRMDYQPEPEPTDPTLRFYRSHAQRQVTPTMDGKTPIYNFDAWSKNHYGDLFEKAKYEKEFLRKRRAKQDDAVQSNQQEIFIYVILLMGALFIGLVTNGRTDYDMVSTKMKAEAAQKTKNEK